MLGIRSKFITFCKYPIISHHWTISQFVFFDCLFCFQEHLLSYFLSNDMNQESYTPVNTNRGQQNIFKNAANTGNTISPSSYPNLRRMTKNPMGNDGNSYIASNKSQSTELKRNTVPKAASTNFMPTTPSVHFYGKSMTLDEYGKQHMQTHVNFVPRNNNTSPSSSSSLPSLAPLTWASSSSLSTTSGGNFVPHTSPQPPPTSVPVLHSDDRQNQMKGVSSEPFLMLPPKPRLPIASSMSTLDATASNDPNQSCKLSHYEWLNQINSYTQKRQQIPQGTNNIPNVNLKNNQNVLDPSLIDANQFHPHNQLFPQANQGSQYYIPQPMNVSTKSDEISTKRERSPSFSTLAASIAEQHENQNKLVQKQQQQQQLMMLQNQHNNPNFVAASLASPFIAQRQNLQIQQQVQVPAALPTMSTVTQTPLRNQPQLNAGMIGNTTKTSNTIGNKNKKSEATIPKISVPIVSSKPITIVPTLQGSKQNQPTESAEKRARRLARNRESARLSRRRKKEHLESLSEKVNQLHNSIETKRRDVMNRMESELRKRRVKELTELATSSDPKNINYMEGKDSLKDANVSGKLSDIINGMGPISATRRAVISFQYNLLRQLILPPQHQYLLWLTLQPEIFFTTAKGKRPKVRIFILERPYTFSI